MAIYHLSAKAIQRSKGHSSVASSAYRAGEKIKDKRTGEVHDYRKKNGVIFSKVVTPNNENISRAELWNMAEKAEKRKDSTTAKEHTLALPAELNAEQRQELALSYAEYLVNSQGCAVDVALHEPNKAGDERNFHAHFLITTRKLENGLLTNKIDMELSDTDRKKKGLAGRKEELEKARTTWENLVNKALEKANIQEKVSSKSLKAQGIDREPTQHQGKTATEMERKGKNPERKRIKDTVLSWGQDLVNTLKNMITSQEKELFDLNKEIEQEKAAALTPIKKELTLEELVYGENFDRAKVEEERKAHKIEKMKQFESLLQKKEEAHQQAEQKIEVVPGTKEPGQTQELDTYAKLAVIPSLRETLNGLALENRDKQDLKLIEEWKKPYLARAEQGQDFLELAKHDSSKEGKAELKNYQNILMQELKPTGWSFYKKQDYVKNYMQELKKEDLAQRGAKVLDIAKDVSKSIQGIGFSKGLSR